MAVTPDTITMMESIGAMERVILALPMQALTRSLLRVPSTTLPLTIRVRQHPLSTMLLQISVQLLQRLSTALQPLMLQPLILPVPLLRMSLEKRKCVLDSVVPSRKGG